MSKVKIPLKWYIDIIKIDKKRFLSFEWFEDEKCKIQTLSCLGKFIKITLGELSEKNINLSNKELSFKKLHNETIGQEQTQIIQENEYYDPYSYFLIKNYSVLEEY